ncbi:hypothetical protein NQ015_00165 [Corynebacterium sp. 153RC1]|uniref:hypothetical protein n=1 Tax=unclassified Corynebacterium TaxID=2624378 RepID=UPI00211C7B77|nr:MULTISPECIES: hypothetical protein [unclassified Corynebacterium]MCQ9364807.1 hypothetical protein [Corynebacterium sp. 70RC1]MCQ9370308.1 hypothetical protein [Corynebacterium sp. 35RC1]MCQ9351682.1 hypothetical protein [Corynebacterium sp. 209RC1]MCQ9354051.1 hypothetical protein [Corynebacterium sp. 1222RC1]MCQ9355965.1 hypothetical protein [Corynebacterium sp. 122RC1]
MPKVSASPPASAPAHEPEPVSQPTEYPHASRARVPGVVGAFALVVMHCVLGNALLGAAWGALRPSYTAWGTEGDGLAFGTEVNVEFSAFAAFLGLTTIVAMLSVWAAVRARAQAQHQEDPFSLPMLLWVGLWNILGAQVFLLLGRQVVQTFRSHAAEAPQVGEMITIVPWVSVGIAGALWSGFAAVALYWSAMVVWLPNTRADSALPARHI